MCQVVYMSCTQALMAVEGCSFDPEAFDGDRSGNMFEEPGNLVWGESHFLHEGPDGTVGVAFGACFMTVDSAYQVSEVSGGDMLAIVDTACTKSVAGHDWFERYADWAASVGYQVITHDHEDQFRFGASCLFTSKFTVEAWFAVMGKFFRVTVAIVPCSVPLLFSRPVLAGLRMTYDLAAQRVDLAALGFTNVPLRTSPTGHLALCVTDCAGASIPFEGPQRSLGEVGLPAEEAYMSVTLPVFSSYHKPLFFPKKLTAEVFGLLSNEEVMGGTGFFMWWNSVKHVRDFWVETDREFIRIHVVPRKHWFDPSKWSTQHSGLKASLMAQLEGSRQTEYVPCLAAGTLVHVQHDRSCHEGGPSEMIGPWIGRSRFVKLASPARGRPEPGTLTSDARTDPLAMEHEEGAVAAGAGRTRGGGASLVDGAGTPANSHRTAGSREATGQQREDEGTHLAEAAGAGGARGEERPDHPNQADKPWCHSDGTRGTCIRKYPTVIFAGPSRRRSPIPTPTKNW